MISKFLVLTLIVSAAPIVTAELPPRRAATQLTSYSQILLKSRQQLAAAAASVQREHSGIYTRLSSRHLMLISLKLSRGLGEREWLTVKPSVEENYAQAFKQVLLSDLEGSEKEATLEVLREHCEQLKINTRPFDLEVAMQSP